MIRVFSKNKNLYMEANPKTEMVYIYESKGNKLLQILSLAELKEYLKNDRWSILNFELIPSDPKEALEWYESKLKEVIEISNNFLKNGYEPLGSMISLMLNYNKNIRHLKKRLKIESY